MTTIQCHVGLLLRAWHFAGTVLGLRPARAASALPAA
jgi:hypothetical protein